MKAIVVGRHKPADIGENFEVVDQQDIVLPSTSEMCFYTLCHLVRTAMLKEAEAIVFQGLPGQMAVAIAEFVCPQCLRIGVIVSVPGERPASITRRFYFDDSTALKEAWGIANHLNPNIEAKEDWEELWLEITVDPPMKFKFSHIEWF